MCPPPTNARDALDWVTLVTLASQASKSICRTRIQNGPTVWTITCWQRWLAWPMITHFSCITDTRTLNCLLWKHCQTGCKQKSPELYLSQWYNLIGCKFCYFNIDRVGENGNQAEFSEKRGEKIRKMVKNSESAKSETQKSGGENLEWVGCRPKKSYFWHFMGGVLVFQNFDHIILPYFLNQRLLTSCAVRQPLHILQRRL